MRPRAQIRALLQNLGAPHQERSHRHRQHLLEHPEIRGCRFVSAWPGANSGGTVHGAFGPRAIPLTCHRQQRHVAAERLYPLKVRFFERTMAPHYIRRLSNHQPKVSELEGNVLETQQRSTLRLVPGKHLGVHLKPWKRDAALDSSMQLDQLEVHVHRIAEFGLPVLDCAEFGCLAGFRPT
jgi:hypothetical protein